ncbi:MAG: chloroplast GrpE protein [Pseudomonadota bacterium]|jgi:molecular chaperone GrpE
MSTPDDPTPSFQIDIDPSLFDEAVAAVDARTRRPSPAPSAGAEGGPPPSATPPPDPVAGDLDVEIDAPAAAAPAPRIPAMNEDVLRARLRLEEAQAAQRRAEAELGRSRARIAELEAQSEAARTELATLREDFERARGRAKRETEDAERRGEERVLKALLDLSDNLERARMHEDADAESLATGLRMIAEQLRRHVERLGLSRVPAARGTTFDPQVHDAVAQVAAADVPAGALVDEVQAGYLHRGRLLRAARVTVAAG